MGAELQRNYEFAIEPHLDTLKELRISGMPWAQAVKEVGITVSSLYSARKRHEDVRVMMQEADAELSAKLVSVAQGSLFDKLQDRMVVSSKQTNTKTLANGDVETSETVAQRLITADIKAITWTLERLDADMYARDEQELMKQRIAKLKSDIEIAGSDSDALLKITQAFVSEYGSIEEEE